MLPFGGLKRSDDIRELLQVASSYRSATRSVSRPSISYESLGTLPVIATCS